MEPPSKGNADNATLAHLEDKIALWTALGPKEQARGVRWFASRPIEEQARIIAEGKSLMPGLRQANPNVADDVHSAYAAFIMAIRGAGFDLIRKRGYRVHGHKNYAQFEALRQGTVASLKRGTQAPLRQDVLALWGDVRGLHTEGNGFLLISRYLLRAHKLKVSASYLAKLWNEVEG